MTWIEHDDLVHALQQLGLLDGQARLIASPTGPDPAVLALLTLIAEEITLLRAALGLPPSSLPATVQAATASASEGGA